MEIPERRGRPIVFSTLKKSECRTVAQKLCWLRSQRKLTRGMFARKIGVSRCYIDMVENGKRSMTDSLRKKVADYCGIPSEWLKDEESEEKT